MVVFSCNNNFCAMIVDKNNDQIGALIWRVDWLCFCWLWKWKFNQENNLEEWQFFWLSNQFSGRPRLVMHVWCLLKTPRLTRFRRDYKFISPVFAREIFELLDADNMWTKKNPWDESSISDTQRHEMSSSINQTAKKDIPIDGILYPAGRSRGIFRRLLKYVRTFFYFCLEIRKPCGARNSESRIDRAAHTRKQSYFASKVNDNNRRV